MTEISFPGLGIDAFQVNSVAFKVFGLEVAWYGVLITIGMILAFVYCMHKAKYEGIKSDDIIDLAILIIIMSISGARLYYVLFELEHFVATGGSVWQNIWQTLLNIINIRDGGLAIYGGVLGGFFAGLIMSKKRKIRFPILLDVLVGGVLIGQIIGRWGNFMNGEAYGYETDILWRMGINKISAGGLYNSYMEVHPTFLYESLWNLIGFLLMAIFYKKKKFHGQHFAFYLIWYGAGRAVIEALRTDSLWLFGEGTIRVSQAVGIITCIIGLVIAVFGVLKVYKGIDVWGMITSKLPKKRTH